MDRDALDPFRVVELLEREALGASRIADAFRTGWICAVEFLVLEFAGWGY